MEKKVRSFDGVRINYDIFRKSKKFIIFLHGIGGDLVAFRKERSFLHKKGYSTIAIDLRGHGFSDRPQLFEDYKLENFAKDLYAVIKKEKISNFVLVGHSFGGVVIIKFYEIYPKLAKAYIFIDSTYKAPKYLKTIFKNHPFLTGLLNKILSDEDLHKKHFDHVDCNKFNHTEDINLPRIYSNVIHTSLKSFIFAYESFSNFNGIKTLKKMKKKVFIINGGKDLFFNYKIAKNMNKIIKNSKLELIPFTNHIIIIREPKFLAKEILKFLESLDNF